MIDPYDASHDGSRFAAARGLSGCDETALLRVLTDPDPVLRTAAARELHVRGTRATLDYSLKLLDHSSADDREIGIFVLGQLGTPECPYAAETFERVPGLLRDDSHEVRAAAATAVGSLASLNRQPPASVVRPLLQLGSDASSDVRASLAFALGMIDDPIVLAPLSTLAEDPDPDVREMAESALEWFKERHLIASSASSSRPEAASGPRSAGRRHG